MEVRKIFAEFGSLNRSAHWLIDFCNNLHQVRTQSKVFKRIAKMKKKPVRFAIPEGD